MHLDFVGVIAWRDETLYDLIKFRQHHAVQDQCVIISIIIIK